MVSGDKEAYEYLASSIAAFYEPEELLAMMRDRRLQYNRAPAAHLRHCHHLHRDQIR